MTQFGVAARNELGCNIQKMFRLSILQNENGQEKMCSPFSYVNDSGFVANHIAVAADGCVDNMRVTRCGIGPPVGLVDVPADQQARTDPLHGPAQLQTAKPSVHKTWYMGV